MSGQAGRVAIVTDASSGIGKEAAKALAGKGWRVIAVGRDPARSAAAADEIRAAATQSPADMLRADLSSLAEVERLAAEIATRTDRIDVLLNNAGNMFADKAITAEGIDRTFAGNHLGPFLLTARLLPLLRRAAALAPPGAVRIVMTASNGSEMIAGLPWDDLPMLADADPGAAYCVSKLANVLHARALATRLAEHGIVAHALHPGTVASNFIAHVGAIARAHMLSLDMMSAGQAADALVWLATGEEPGKSSGGYWYGREARTHPLADDASAERLWAESARLIAERGGTEAGADLA